MNPSRVMLVAGESSGDTLAAELVQAWRQAAGDPSPSFFGAGGPRMAAAGVQLDLDLTAHAVVGLVEVLRKLLDFRRIFHRLLDLAAANRPDAVVLVDFSGFNRRFARALRQRQRAANAAGTPWHPRIIQFVSPQVWASRPGRAQHLARDLDLLLTIFPFEKDWYAARVPELRVEFVGHPMLDRYAPYTPAPPPAASAPPLLLLLPGSREGELRRHLPPMLAAAAQVRAALPVSLAMVFPSEKLLELARTIAPLPGELQVQVGGLASRLAETTVAIASTGTVTMECAYFRVPTVALYKTSWSTYQIGRRIIQVSHLAMPNLLAGTTVFPELIQHQATAENIAAAALELLRQPERRRHIQTQLDQVIASLGGPGASARAAQAILRLFQP